MQNWCLSVVQDIVAYSVRFTIGGLTRIVQSWNLETHACPTPRIYCKIVHKNVHENRTKPLKKKPPHSFKGQQLENKSLYRFVISMSFLEKFLSYNLTLSL